jgi:hypothetical protein
MALALWVDRAEPREERHIVLDVDSEMFTIPFD